ncbi:nucleoporin-interacting protein NIC96 [Wolfiporia cocos MD-104 SS10]|uniref:Nuclear pore protein n=1 Tax=Wolfiporia cocos (strain MD-104) TaxID=742152 RepID=A0A2H3IT04_WOLCO|nr:nucleoporin-interacting protein NIC96 [Wolfiporia cocos MD-104 SS10]
MATDLSSLLTASKALTSHLSRQDLPSVNLGLDQIEAQSRRLVSRQPGASTDIDRANYLLAQAHVDAPALADSIAHLNTSTTFTPLQALQDTDVAGYIRHAHEQNLITTIEEGRKETQEDFYRVLDERQQRDWEARKKRVFEQLGGRVSGDNKALVDAKKSLHGKSILGASTINVPSVQTQSKMMAYDRVITELNAARLRGTSYPVVHALIQASLSLTQDPISLQLTQNFHVLSKITEEPPALPSFEHAGAHILNTPLFERKYARVYLGDPESREAADLRKQIARGAREALEEQYWDVLERTLLAHPMEARLGGDPSISNKARAFVLVRHYRGGEWDDRIELISGQPLWTKLYYLVRTGHTREAIAEATRYQQAIEHREAGFLSHFRTWLESPDRRLPRAQRDQVNAVFNAHMLHSSTTDPFKLALYKLMGKIDPSRRSVHNVTVTTEDWLWFQLSMIEEEENGGLRGLAEVLLSYGERHFDGVPGQKGGKRGVWAGVLLMCGQFERAVAALWDHQETEIEAVHLAIALAYHGLLRVPSKAETSDMTPLSLTPSNPPALSLSTVIWRYVRQFVKMDPREALQYVYCVCLSADQGDGIGREQLESAWELVRRIVVHTKTGAPWEELVGGFRADGTRFSGIIEQGATLLKLENMREYNEEILIRAAKHSEQNDRIPEAIKLYNLAGDYNTVIACLAQALGNTIGQPSSDETVQTIEKTAADILRNYERTNRAVGKERDAVLRLLRVREATDAKDADRVDLALELMESTDLIPMDGDVLKIQKRAEEFRDLPEALQRNLQTFLTLTMDVLAASHRKLKASLVTDASRKEKLASLQTKSRSLIIFAGLLKYRMSPDVYAYLAKLDVEISL